MIRHGTRHQVTRAIRIGTQAVLSAALLLGLGTAMGAYAQDDQAGLDIDPEFGSVWSRVELGSYFSNQDSFRFGDYTGLDEDGFSMLGSMDVRIRGNYDGPSTAYWRLQGSNLGLDSRNMRVEYGHQGRFRLALDYDQLPKLREDHTFKFQGGVDGAYLTLPTPWTPGNSTGALTDLSSSARLLDVEHERRRLGAEAALLLTEDLNLRARFSRETKQGTKLTGAMFASSGGTPRAANLAEPVDWETREVDVGIDYSLFGANLRLGYYSSWFNNRDDSLTWQNLFAGTGGWSPLADSPAPGTKGLPPDNRFDQVTLASAYGLTSNTTLTLNAAFGWMRQNETYLPYTSNTLLAAPIALPRNSLDGKIDTTFLNFGIHSRPFRKLTLNASYRYDDRDNRTPRDMYTYVIADTSPQDVSPANSKQRFNLPYSSKEKELSLGASYRLLPRTDLTFDFQNEEIERDFTEVDTTRENKFGLQLNTRPTRFLNARLYAKRATRDASTYRHNLPYLLGHNPAYTGGSGFENDPNLRRFHLADRDRSDYGAMLTILPIEPLSIDLRADLVDEDYDHTIVGLTDRRTLSYTVDVSFAATETIRTYAFYTREQLSSDQHGHSFSGFAVGPHLADPTRAWTNEETDDNDTMGFGLEAQLIPDKLDLRLEYLFSRSRVEIKPENGSGLPAVVPFPDLVSRLHDARISAEYKISEGTSLRLAYLFEKFDWSDFGYDSLGLDTTRDVVNTAEGTPDDRGSLFMFSVVYRFL